METVLVVVALLLVILFGLLAAANLPARVNWLGLAVACLGIALLVPHLGLH